MKAIYNYKLSFEESQVIVMPTDAQILSLSNQHDQMILFVLADADAHLKPCTFRMFRTWDIIEDSEAKSLQYIGTCFIESRGMTYHIFKKNE